MDAQLSQTPRKTWFEENPKKTLIGVILVFSVILDALAGSFFIRDATIASPYYHHAFRKSNRIALTWGDPSGKAGEYRKWVQYTNSLTFKDSRVGAIPLTSDKHRIVLIH